MRTVIILITLLALTACGRPGRDKAEAGPSSFVIDYRVKTTPVKQQGKSTLCWAYAMLATIESEHLMKGDSVNLSADYVARRFIEQQADRSFFAPERGKVSLRGMSSMLLRLVETYGIEPYDSYYNEPAVDYNLVCREVEQVVKAAPTVEKMRQRVADLLDRRVGFMPVKVFMLGMVYTPREFAHSVCLPGEYLSLTSFTHHPFGQHVVLEMPDNRMADRFYNLPIDSLMRHIVKALRSGHPVCWEGDISEPGFSAAAGQADLPRRFGPVDQQRRQRALETFETTDDHCMQLCGLAHDRQGNRYFLAKNSWGNTGPYGGFMFLSYDYVKLKTIACYMSREAFDGR